MLQQMGIRQGCRGLEIRVRWKTEPATQNERGMAMVQRRRRSDRKKTASKTLAASIDIYRKLMRMHIIVLGFAYEQDADDRTRQRDDDRIPQAVVDIALEGHQRECRGRQQATKPAVADVIGQ